MNIALSSGKCFSLLYIHVIYLMFCIKKQKKWKRINKHFTMNELLDILPDGVIIFI